MLIEHVENTATACSHSSTMSAHQMRLQQCDMRCISSDETPIYCSALRYPELSHSSIQSQDGACMTGCTVSKIKNVNIFLRDNYEKRLLYTAVTRAKKLLDIYYLN